MGSPFASLSATRGFSVNVDPSFRVPVSGRPWAAGDPLAAADSAGAALGAAAEGALVAGAAPPQAATSNEAAAATVTAPREPIRIVCSSSRTPVPVTAGASVSFPAGDDVNVTGKDFVSCAVRACNPVVPRGPPGPRIAWSAVVPSA